MARRMHVLIATVVAAASALLSTSAGAEPPVATVSIWRVFVDDQADIDALLAGGYDLVEGRGPDFLLVVGEDEVADRLRREGFRVQQDRSLESLPGVGTRRSPNGELLATATYYGGYRTVDEHYLHLDTVAATYPTLAAVVDYGDSWRKVQGQPTGNELRAICLTKLQAGDCVLSPGSAKPRAVVMAAIHARELQTSELAWRLIDALTQGYGTDPDVTQIMDTTEVWVIPVVNPDGREIVESGGNSPYLQRKNANNSLGNCAVPPTASNQHGVDLNRNATFGWGGVGTSTDPCAQTYRGGSASSEPEQQSLELLFSQLWPDQKGPNRNDAVPTSATGTFITLHSYGNLVLLPPGDGALTPNDAQLRALAFRMSHFNGYVTGTGPETLYGTTGTTDDHTYFTLGVASFTFEVSPTSGNCSGFTPAYSCIDSTIWPLNKPALLYALKVAGSPYVTPRGPTTTSVSAPAATAQGSNVTITATVNDNAFGSATGSVGRPAAQAITAAEIYVDVPPTAGGAPVAMSASDGTFNASSENAVASIPTAGLPLGTHRVWVRARNAGGFWGPLTGATFNVVESTAGQTLLDDTFTGGAGNWSALSGNATWSIVNVSGDSEYQGSASSQSSNGARVAGSSAWTDYSVEVDTVTTTQRRAGRGPAVLARVTDASNYYRFGYSSSGRWAIERVQGGTVTTLAQSAPATLTIGTTFVLRADLDGTTLTFSVNGTTVASATDAAFAGGRVGLRVYGSVTRFDDVTVTSL